MRSYQGSTSQCQHLKFRTQGPDLQSICRITTCHNYILYHRLTSDVVLQLLCGMGPRVRGLDRRLQGLDAWEEMLLGVVTCRGW